MDLLGTGAGAWNRMEKAPKLNADVVRQKFEDNGFSRTEAATGPSSRLEATVTFNLSTGELIGVVVVSALVAAAIVTLAIWLRCRRKKKTNNLATNLDLANNKATLQTAVIMDTDKTIASRQNSLGGASFKSISEEVDEEAFTDYGSVIGSFPPSPTLSFNSIVEGPAFSRSRSGTGTSFGTVASFGSDWARRSRASTSASFRTCLDEDVSLGNI